MVKSKISKALSGGLLASSVDLSSLSPPFSYSVSSSALLVSLYIKPNAQQSDIVAKPFLPNGFLSSSHDASSQPFHIQIAAQPQDGAANQEIVHFLSRVMPIHRMRVSTD